MLSPTLDTVRLFLHVLAASVWVGGQIEQQNRGVGSAVLDKILYLCDRDRRDCQVSIAEGNRAIALFKRHGFREVGRDEDHIQLLRNWRFP